MSAETLRRAASLMRERAEAATPGPWSAADEHGLLGPDASPAWCISNMRPGFESMSPTDGYLGDVAETSLGFPEARDEHNAEHIASWHPAVALAVARAIEDVAQAWEISDGWVRDLDDDGIRFEDTVDGGWLTVARAYLGETA